MFMMPSLIKMYENLINMLGLPGKSAAKADEDFYDTDTLSTGERQQAMALLAEQKAAEGSIFLLYSNPRDRFDAFCADQALTGRNRGEMVVQDFDGGHDAALGLREPAALHRAESVAVAAEDAGAARLARGGRKGAGPAAGWTWACGGGSRAAG